MKTSSFKWWVAAFAVNLICWAALAVYFGKWWIALFAALFTPSFQMAKKPMTLCDGCGKQLIHERNADRVLDLARAGWEHRRAENGGWLDFCPDCQAKGRNHA